MNESYSRCKACNIPFYPRYIPRRQTFEELCTVCLSIALGNDNSEDSDFLTGFLADKIEDYDDGD